jgi:hypothetical protein
MAYQKAYSFDRATIKKIIVGGFIATTGGAILGLLNYIGTIEISNPILASVVVTTVPILVNMVKEYINGN